MIPIRPINLISAVVQASWPPAIPTANQTSLMAATPTTPATQPVRQTPLKSGVTYEFWLVGHNSQGDGPESNHVTHVAA